MKHAAPLHPDGRPARRVLLAEDMAVDRIVAMGILTRLGLEVDAVDTGLEAVAAVRAHDYGLVLMDIQMPEMDGDTATRVIRSLPTDERDVPIIAMTSAPEGSRGLECLEAGMDDFVPKPPSRSALARLCARWLGERHGTFGPAPLVMPSREGELDLLDRLSGDVVWASRAAAAFLFEVPAQIRALLEHARVADMSGVLRTAHALKGTAQCIGGPALYFAARAAEGAAYARHTERLVAASAEVEEAYRRLSVDLCDLVAQWESQACPTPAGSGSLTVEDSLRAEASTLRRA